MYGVATVSAFLTVGFSCWGRESQGVRDESAVSSVAEGFNNETLGGMHADHTEPFGTDGSKPVRRFRPDDDDVSGAGNNLFPIKNHRRSAGEHYTGLRVRVLMQSRALPRRKIAQKEGNPAAVWFPFELDGGNCAFPLIATMHDFEHSPPIDAGFRLHATFTMLAAKPEEQPSSRGGA